MHQHPRALEHAGREPSRSSHIPAARSCGRCRGSHSEALGLTPERGRTNDDAEADEPQMTASLERAIALSFKPWKRHEHNCGCTSAGSGSGGGGSSMNPAPSGPRQPRHGSLRWPTLTVTQRRRSINCRALSHDRNEALALTPLSPPPPPLPCAFLSSYADEALDLPPTETETVTEAPPLTTRTLSWGWGALDLSTRRRPPPFSFCRAHSCATL